MPFDGTESNPSVLIVEQMIYMLDERDRWIKNQEQVRRSDGTFAVCLYGALRLATSALPKHERRATEKLICHAMNTVINQVTSYKEYRLAKRLASIGLMPHALMMQFNDDGTTNHQAVMHVLYQTRARLCIATPAPV